MSIINQDGSSKSTASKSRPNLSNEQRKIIFEHLLRQSENGKLKWGSFKVVASLFSVSERTVRRIWNQAKPFMQNGDAVDVSNKLAQRVGRKKIQIDPTTISQIPLSQRTSLRALAYASNMSLATMCRRVKEGAIRAHSNRLKPYLTDADKKARLQYCISMLEDNNNRLFKNMYNYVHIDEKWFNMTKDGQRYYLLPTEKDPDRKCKSKNHIIKVMFMAAVARPRFDSSGNELFSGKIGIFPFTFQEPAKRNSKNRPAGTLETKPLTSVTQDIIRSCLINKVLPAIRNTWPHDDATNVIYIQQDNARPHISSNDVEFVEAASRDGFDIRLCFQPPNSPDLNVLDLGFFRAIQSLQYREAPTTVDELVHAVEKAFEELSTKSLDYVFLTLQACMIEIMKVHGDNNYRVPHIKKAHLERNSVLPVQLECDTQIVECALQNL